MNSNLSSLGSNFRSELTLSVEKAKNIVSEIFENRSKNHTRNEWRRCEDRVNVQIQRLSKLMSDFEMKYSETTTLQTSGEDQSSPPETSGEDADPTDALLLKYTHFDLSESVLCEKAVSLRDINDEAQKIKGIFQEEKIHSSRVCLCIFSTRFECSFTVL